MVSKEDKKYLENMLKSVDKFPGSLEEYKDFKKGNYEIMDTTNSYKYVALNPYYGGEELLIKLFREGCTAFVRYHPKISVGSEPDWGMPVRKVP